MAKGDKKSPMRRSAGLKSGNGRYEEKRGSKSENMPASAYGKAGVRVGVSSASAKTSIKPTGAGRTPKNKGGSGGNPGKK